MAGFEQTYEGLKNLILRDQFFTTCDKLMQTFLKEKGKMTFKEMSLTAANYIDALGYQNDVHNNAVNKKGPAVHKKFNDRVEPNGKQVMVGPYSHCGMRNHETENCQCVHYGSR